MFIVHDLGHLLCYSTDSISIIAPDYLQDQFNTSPYADMLHAICQHRIIRDIVHRTLPTPVISALIATLMHGVVFPEFKSTQATQLSAMKLEHDLTNKSQNQIWQAMDPGIRPKVESYLSTDILSKILHNLKQLKGEEISLLIQYGPHVWGNSDISQMMDILSLLNLPSIGQHIVSQMLRLIPMVQTSSQKKGGQVYPMGGYEGISTKGDIDNLIPSEFCYQADMLFHRIFNHESLYYSRESIPDTEKELIWIIAQTGLDMKGDADIIVRSLSLALWHQLKQRDVDIYHSFMGKTLTPPRKLQKISDIHSILYYKDKGWQAPDVILPEIIQRLKNEKENYPQRHVYWILSEHWDADFYDTHCAWYDDIKKQASFNHAYLIQSGFLPVKTPAVSTNFSSFQTISTDILSTADILSHIPTAEKTMASISLEPEAPAKQIVNSLGMTFVLIPAGTFMMGSPEDEPGRFAEREVRHEVTLTQPYYMQTTQVTQGQWESVMGNNPSHFKDGGPNCPVENVSWEDTQAFISKLNQQESTGKYRLPTEAEWEYACRAGTEGPFYFGNCLSTDQANYNGNYPLEGCPKGERRGKTTPVGNFECNKYGLYDMHGNVLEWCQDWLGDYPTSAVTDPTGPENGAYRVLRGGSWFYYARNCRSAYRLRYGPGYRYRDTGFRLVFSPGQH
jgi:formylglycine-generating enzyme required for sulfatase activity